MLAVQLSSVNKINSASLIFRSLKWIFFKIVIYVYTPKHFGISLKKIAYFCKIFGNIYLMLNEHFSYLALVAALTGDADYLFLPEHPADPD